MSCHILWAFSAPVTLAIAASAADTCRASPGHRTRHSSEERSDAPMPRSHHGHVMAVGESGRRQCGSVHHPRVGPSGGVIDPALAPDTLVR